MGQLTQICASSDDKVVKWHQPHEVRFEVRVVDNSCREKSMRRFMKSRRMEKLRTLIIDSKCKMVQDYLPKSFFVQFHIRWILPGRCSERLL